MSDAQWACSDDAFEYGRGLLNDGAVALRELRVWAFNTRAIRAYEKSGFVLKGRRREAVFHDGKFHDELVMSVLAADYFGG